MFGRRKKRQQQEEAAREAERRALFEELAKRPDTVCPFLGLEDARTEFRSRVSDQHRCYAFGDPADLSAEQQQKVCLQRGYGNCPRYLRGVLVIPTEELEALRRPQAAPPPPPPGARPVPAAGDQPAGRDWRRTLLAIAGVVLLLAMAGGAGYLYLSSRVPDSTAATTLPAGTELRAELVSLSAPTGGEQQVEATAFIGETTGAAPTTALVYVFDLSTSTLRGTGCGGDPNDDGRDDTPLDCEIAAATALNEQAVTSGTVSEVGLVGFADGGVSADLAGADGPQSLVAPDLDDDGDGTPNVVAAMASAFSAPRGEAVGFRAHTEVTTLSRATTFSAGIEAACDILAGAASANRVVVFLSDGNNSAGAAVSSVLPCEGGVTFQTFAAGPDAGCELPSDFGNLQEVADLSEGTCTEVTDLSQLPQILESVVDPQLVRVELTIDDGEPVDITSLASPALPTAGPADVTVRYSIPALPPGDHELCMTFVGTDAGGSGMVTTCSRADADGGPLTAG